MTSKPISTISYNTEAFLKEKLESWVKAHIIQTYMYVCHKGEDGDKDHIHLRIEPNKKLDPMTLSEELLEYEKGKDKPLGCRPWRPSKEEDWFLYAVHDQEYLKLKYGGGEKGEKIPYKWQDIKVPENYDLEIAFIRAKQNLEHTTSNIAKRISEGEKPINLMYEGENVHTINAICRALSDNDYRTLAKKYKDLKDRYIKLCDCLYQNDIVIEWDQEERPKIKKTDAETSADMKKIC